MTDSNYPFNLCPAERVTSALLELHGQEKALEIAANIAADMLSDNEVSGYAFMQDVIDQLNAIHNQVVH